MTGGKLDAIRKRVLGSAVFYGALGTAVRLGANILLLPIVLKVLTPSELALWWVFVALGGLANLTDFGFAQASSRVYSFLWAGAENFDTEGLRHPTAGKVPNMPQLRRLNATNQLLYRRLAYGAGSLLAIGGTIYLLELMKATSQPGQAWLAWAVYVIAVSYSLSISHWATACQGVNRMRELQASYVWSGLAYLLSATALLWLGWALFSMAVATIIRGWLGGWLTRQAYRQAVGEANADSVEPDLSMLRRLWPNARKFGVLAIGVYLCSNGSLLICGHFLDTNTTASYGLTMQVGTFLVSCAALWLTVKWPQITILRTQGRLEEMGVLFAQRLAWVMGTFIVLSVLLVVLGNRILEWKATHTRLLPTAYLILYLFHLGQQQFHAQFGTLTFTENVVPFFKISLFTGFGVILLSIVLTPLYGLVGLLAAPLIAMGACVSWYPVWRGFKGQPLSVPQFVRAALWGRI